MECPVCGSKNMGKIRFSLYFCRDCFSEVKVEKGEFKAFEINSDGSVKVISQTQTAIS